MPHGYPMHLCGHLRCGHPLAMHNDDGTCSWPTCPCKKGITSLTPAQMELLTMLANHKQLKEIGTILGISNKTVEAQLSRIHTKTRTRSIVQLVVGSIHDGLIDPKDLPGLPISVAPPRRHSFSVLRGRLG